MSKQKQLSARFLQSSPKGRKVDVGGTIVSFCFKGNSLHSVTEFHLISSFFLLNKCFLSLIICGIFSIANTSHADGREMQGRWLRIRRQWAVKNHAKSCIGTTVIFLLCIKKKDNFLTPFTSETEYSLNSHFPKQHYGTGWGFWLFTKIPIDTFHYFFLALVKILYCIWECCWKESRIDKPTLYFSSGSTKFYPTYNCCQFICLTLLWPKEKVLTT